MKSLKEQLNSAINKSEDIRRLSDVELTALKKCILDIYLRVKDICDSNGLSLLLTGGSCLGSIRHQGFIPWDDDLDLMMPRPDYNKLLDLCEKGALGKEFSFTYPSPNHDAPCAFLKIYLNDSLLIGLTGRSSKYPNGVFVDVFPVEGAPSSVLVRKLKGHFANILRLCANMVDSKDPWTKEERMLYSRERGLLRNMKIRQLVGKVLAIIPHKRWICWYDSFIRKETIGEFSVIPTGRKLYVGETLPTAVYFPPSKGLFEGLEVMLPANPDLYLKNLYGDYMLIPPENKRESHFIRHLELPKKYYLSTK